MIVRAYIRWGGFLDHCLWCPGELFAAHWHTCSSPHGDHISLNARALVRICKRSERSISRKWIEVCYFSATCVIFLSLQN